MLSKNHKIMQFIKLWLIWNVVAYLSLVGFLVPILISVVFAGPYSGYDYALMYAILLLGLVLGSIFMGLIQWITFRNKIIHAYWWVLATALGSSLVGVLLFFLFFLYYSFSEANISEIVLAIITGAIGGVVLGLSQWLVIRGQVRGAGWWILGSVLGWASFGYAMDVIFLNAMSVSLIDQLIHSLIVPLPLGMITGVVYAYFFTQPSKMRLA